MNRERLYLKFDNGTVPTPDEGGAFDGVLSTYNNVDLGGDKVAPGAFTSTIEERGGQIPLLWQHDRNEIIGKLMLADSPSGLKVKGQIVLDVQRGREAYALLKAGCMSGLSMGFRPVRSTKQGGVTILEEVKLYEGSLVDWPMNPKARVTAVKSLEVKADFNFEFERARTVQARYLAMQSLDAALSSAIWGQEHKTAEARVEAALASLEQFNEAMQALIPQIIEAYYAKSEDRDDRAYKADAETLKQMREARAALDNLLTSSEILDAEVSALSTSLQQWGETLAALPA